MLSTVRWRYVSCPLIVVIQILITCSNSCRNSAEAQRLPRSRLALAPKVMAATARSHGSVDLLVGLLPGGRATTTVARMADHRRHGPAIVTGATTTTATTTITTKAIAAPAVLEPLHGTSRSSSSIRHPGPRADTRHILDTVATARRLEWALLLACPSLVLALRLLQALIPMASMPSFSSTPEVLRLRRLHRLGMRHLLPQATIHLPRRPATSLLHRHLPATKFCSLTTLTC